MARKLARIETIDAIEQIPGADLIELAKVKEWQFVVRKADGFKPGMKGVYFEIDAFLPFKEPYMFLKDSSYKKDVAGDEGFRIRTKRFKGAWSQGLFLPISLFEKDIPGINDMPVGTDVSERLGVKNYEAPVPACLNGLVKGSFPGFMPKTDQENIQNIPEYIDRYKGIAFEATEKIDGTSMTIYYRDGTFGICKRNFELKLDGDDSFVETARGLDIGKWMKEHGKNIAIQGELAGSNISGNSLKFANHRFFVFDIYDIDIGRFLTPPDRMQVFSWFKERIPQLEHVPVINPSIKIFEEKRSVNELLDMADGPSMINPKVKREGIVFKSIDLVGGNTVSFKVVSNSYRMKQDDAR